MLWDVPRSRGDVENVLLNLMNLFEKSKRQNHYEWSHGKPQFEPEFWLKNKCLNPLFEEL